MNSALEIAPRDADRNLGCGDGPEAETDLGAPLSRMPVAAVDLTDETATVRKVGLDERPDRGRALAPGRMAVMHARRRSDFAIGRQGKKDVQPEKTVAG